MLDRILVPLDGSELAEGVLPLVAELARKPASEVVLLRVYTPRVIPAPDAYTTADSGEPEATQYIESKVLRLREKGVRARGTARLGSSAGTILDVASEERATMIAMATHGRSGMARWTLGSVAEKVLRASPVPVFIHRAMAEATIKSPPFGRILLPLDGSDLARSIVPSIAEMARTFGSRVLLMHVAEPDHPEAAEGVQSIMTDLVAQGVEGSVIVRTGDPASQILEVAGAHEIGLLAMSTHGRTGPTRWIFGSVTEKVLRAAEVPMLVVRAKTAAKTETVAKEAARKE